MVVWAIHKKKTKKIVHDSQINVLQQKVQFSQYRELE